MSNTTDRRQIATAGLSSLYRDLMRAMFGYRPERHYMRGPGPAWQAKKGSGNRPPSFNGKQLLGSTTE